MSAQNNIETGQSEDRYGIAINPNSVSSIIVRPLADTLESLRLNPGSTKQAITSVIHTDDPTWGEKTFEVTINTFPFKTEYYSRGGYIITGHRTYTAYTLREVGEETSYVVRTDQSSFDPTDRKVDMIVKRDPQRNVFSRPNEEDLLRAQTIADSISTQFISGEVEEKVGAYIPA